MAAVLGPRGTTTDHRSLAHTLRGSAFSWVARRPPVVMYHTVGPNLDALGLTITPERFQRQMSVLRRLGLTGVSFADLCDAAARGRANGLVGLTFDDGYREVLHYAIPVLRYYGFGATVFVVAGLLGGENTWDPPPGRPLLTADDVRTISGHGFEVGSHSVTHAQLTNVSMDRVRREVENSREILGKVTGTAPRCFCYPYGSVDAGVLEAVMKAGYSYACAVHRVGDLPTQYARPRIGALERDSAPRFIAKLIRRGR